jgi:hypothetical protein
MEKWTAQSYYLLDDSIRSDINDWLDTIVKQYASTPMNKNITALQDFLNNIDVRLPPPIPPLPSPPLPSRIFISFLRLQLSVPPCEGGISFILFQAFSEYFTERQIETFLQHTSLDIVSQQREHSRLGGGSSSLCCHQHGRKINSRAADID